jgi:flagellar assembly factor FliW
VIKVNEKQLEGKILGFEEYARYTLKDSLGESSPFRVLSCDEAPVAFVVVNPYSIVEDYSFDVDDAVLHGLGFSQAPAEEIAVLCVVRLDEDRLYVNLRSPLVINTRKGSFVQIILQNEAYGVSVPFAAKPQMDNAIPANG